MKSIVKKKKEMVLKLMIRRKWGTAASNITINEQS